MLILAEFLRKHKYTARYDILWRFVAGLLDAEGKAKAFFDVIEAEPLDLLGPTHQRLVMHCLSEVSMEMPRRRSLEEKLSQWLLFECKFCHSTNLAVEGNFQSMPLYSVIERGHEAVKKAVLQSLATRSIIPSSIIGLATSLLGDEDHGVRTAAALALGCQSNLPESILTAVAARLEDKDSGVRTAAVMALGRQSKPTRIDPHGHGGSAGG